MSRTALVTGATQGLGLALVAGLAQRMDQDDTVYLTGRDTGRVEHAVASLPPGRASVRGELLDVAAPHGAVDVVVGNAVMRVGPDDEARKIVGEYTEVNNFGTTRLLRAFAPRLPDGGRLLMVASSLGTLHHLAPVLHDRFDGPGALDQVDAAVAAWRDAGADGSARAGGWPRFLD